MAETAVIEVKGMMCGGCERSVRQALLGLDGVSRVVAEHIGDEVEVEYDPAVASLDDIRAAITAAGFAA